MQVPLFAGVSKSNKVVVVKDKRVFTKELPFHPYVITTQPAHLPNVICTKLPDNARSIPGSKAVPMWRLSSSSIAGMWGLRNELDKRNIKYARIGYLEQILIDRPQYFANAAQTQDLTTVTLDIEVLTTGDGYFPRPVSNPITSIGVKLNDEPAFLFDNYEQAPGDSDQQLLRDFVQWWKQVDPDILIGFNSKEFDFNHYIIERMRYWGMDTTVFSRTPQLNDVLGGRVHLDLYEYADTDQNLMGIKSRGLKDVASWFGYKFRHPDMDMANNQALLGTREFEEYQIDDIEATYLLSKVYLPTIQVLAGILHAPLNMVAGCAPSFIPKILIGRNCSRLGIYTTASNMDRYANAFPDNLKYEGALVESHATGYITGIEKWDFTSMYPNAIRSLNLGPDTTHIVKLEVGKTIVDDFECDKCDGYLEFRIWDNNLQRTITIHTRTDEDGILRMEMDRFMDERKAVKQAQAEESDTNKWMALDSQQLALKVVMNSIYGYLGSPYASYGDLASGIVITGFCRWLSGHVKNWIGTDLLVNVDTDGFIKRVDPNSSLDRVNGQISRLVRGMSGMTNRMVLEQEPLIDGFFHRMKNYIIRKLNKRNEVVTIRHGVAFKSSRQAKIVDDALGKLSERIFSGEATDHAFIQSLMAPSKTLRDYALRLTFSKIPALYSDGSLQRKLGIQWEESTQSQVEPGLQITYYVTKQMANSPALQEWAQSHKLKMKSHYTIAAHVRSVEDINVSYYLDSITDYLEKFGIEDPSKSAQTSLCF